MQKQEATIVGLIYIGAGSSWYQDTDEITVATECAKICKADWKHLFKFKRKQDFAVNLYDISKCNKGWFATNNGVFDEETSKLLPFIKTIYVVA